MIHSSTNRTIVSLLILTAIFLQTAPAAAQWQNCGKSIPQVPGVMSVAGRDGWVVMAWSDDRTGDQNVYIQRLDELGNPVYPAGGLQVCDAPDHQYLNGMVLDGSGGVIVVWEDYRSRHAAVTDRSITVNLETAHPAGFLDYFDIYAQRIDSGGNILWTENGVAVCAEPEYQGNVSILGDGTGGAFFAWEDARWNEDYDIYAQHLDSLGSVMAMPGGYPVCQVSTSEKGFPQLVTDGGDGAFVIWRDTQASGYYNLHAQHINSYCYPTWGFYPCALNITGGGSQWFWGAVSDDAGGFIVAYTASYNVGGVFAQRVDGSASLLWGAGGVELYNGTMTWAVDVIPNGIGGAIVVWDIDFGGYGDVAAMSIDATGDTVWSAGIDFLCNSEIIPSHLDYAPDGSGGMFVAWVDYYRHEPQAMVYVQHIDAAGGCVWPETGVPVCGSTTQNQVDPHAVADGQGGAIVVWEQYDDPLDRTVFANRFRYGTNIQESPPVYQNRLGQNFPNPFNPATAISFELANPGEVSLRVYNVTGKLVRTLLAEHRSAGPHLVKFDGTDGSGRPAASGIYFYRLQSGNYSQTKKMVLLK